MPLFEIPNYIPDDWEFPRVNLHDGFVHIKYEDGTEVYIDGEEDRIEDVETHFPDGSVHLEWGADYDTPEFFGADT